MPRLSGRCTVEDKSKVRWAKLERWVAKLWRWVTKLVARLLATAALSKIQNGRHKHRICKRALALPKKYTKRYKANVEWPLNSWKQGPCVWDLPTVKDKWKEYVAAKPLRTNVKSTWPPNHCGQMLRVRGRQTVADKCQVCGFYKTETPVASWALCLNLWSAYRPHSAFITPVTL